MFFSYMDRKVATILNQEPPRTKEFKVAWESSCIYRAQLDARHNYRTGHLRNWKEYLSIWDIRLEENLNNRPRGL